MITLDRWREFVMPRRIIFPRLELIGLDNAPPIVTGNGEVKMDSPSHFAFTLSGIPSDIAYALVEFTRQQQNPYDPLARFRLIGVDEHGNNWSGGWTSPRIDTDGTSWTFSGELQSLTVVDASDTVSRQTGAEAIFLLRTGDPMAIHFARYVWTDRLGEKAKREYEFETLKSKIRFVYEDSSSTLLVTATESPDLRAPFAENWIAEPLRVLFGQLIFPRLVARNFGDGHAQVTIRPSPGLVRGAGWAALWRKETAEDGGAFWLTYRQLLTKIARGRDKDGNPNFEANKITRLYEECVQAARGTRWVWALTFAASIEALARELTGKDGKAAISEAASHTDACVKDLTKHIQNWRGSDHLKEIAISAVRRSGELTPVRALRSLRDAGVIKASQFDAWNKIRNSVMHGSLISPFSTEEEDAKLIALSETMHVLTRAVLIRTDVA